MRLWDKEIMAIKKPIIEKYINKNGNNVSAACRELGLCRSSVMNLIDRYEIKVGERTDFSITKKYGFAMRKEFYPKFKEVLKYYYSMNGYKINKTAKQLGVNAKTLRIAMEQSGFIFDRKGWEYENS